MLGDWLTSFSLIFDDIMIGIFIYYFWGLVISRFGSLILKPLLKKAGILSFSPFGEYLNTAKVDDKIYLFVEVANMYRTLSSLFICLLLLLVFENTINKYPAVAEYAIVPATIVLVVIFVAAYQKQTNFINKRIKHANQTKDAELLKNHDKDITLNTKQPPQ